MTRYQIGQYFHHWLQYVNTKKPPGVAKYTFDTAHITNNAIGEIERRLFPGFATMVLATRMRDGQETAGHYFVLAKDDTNRTYILDPQVRYVVQSHQIAEYITQAQLTDGYVYAFQVTPERTPNELRNDFRSGFSVFDNIERGILKVGDMTFRIFSLADMPDDAIGEVDKVLATCFENAGGDYSLSAVARQSRQRYGIVLGSSSPADTEALSLQNISNNVHFACLLTNVTTTHLYISHVCIHRRYRGRRHMRDFIRMLVEAYPSNTFSLIAAKGAYEGLTLSDRISLYSRFGFYVTPGTWVRFRDVFGNISPKWYAVRNGYVQRHGATYVVVSQEGFQQTILESQIVDCGPSDGAPMQTSSGEIRGMLPSEVCVRN